jgi:phospholipid transport system substrate-binding protein
MEKEKGMNRAFPLRLPRRVRLDPARCASLAAAAALAGALCAGLPARAADALPAADAATLAPDTMIMNLSSEVLESIRNDKAIQAGDFERVQKLVNERILPHVDFDKMTRLAVGRTWRGATSAQRAALIEQFRILLLRTYSGALSKVTDHKVRLRPSHGQEDPADVIVRTQIVPSQGDPIGLDYRLEKTAAGWKVYDLNILGVWLVENYKNEFGATLNQGGIDALIKTLTDKNQKLASGAKTS